MQSRQGEEYEGVYKKTKPSGVNTERLHLKNSGRYWT